MKINYNFIIEPIDKSKRKTRLNGAPKIIIYTHQGLGDQIECNGLIRSFLNKYEQIFIFAKSHYFDMVKYMYRDEEKIQVLSICHGLKPEGKDCASYYMNVDKNNFDYLVVGHGDYGKGRGKNCSQIFYDIVNVPYENKIKNFFYKREEKEEDRVFKKLNPNNEEYIFVHDDPQRGFNLNVKSKKLIIRNDKSENIFYMRKILENASEIHCMNSSILCFMEQLETKAKLFHYPIRGSSKGLFKQWETVKIK